MTEETSTFHKRHEYLGSMVLRLFPKIMQSILTGHIFPKVLKTKYETKKLHVALTDAEIALMEQLPNTDNFTVALCYKILRYEQLVKDPNCDWINEPHATEIEIADDIQRIPCKINDILSKETKDITEDYYLNFTKTLSEIMSRIDAYLEQDTCHTLYQELHMSMENTVVPTCLQELANIRPIGDIIIDSTKEECRRRDRVSRIAYVIIAKFPYFLRCIIEKQNTPSQIYQHVAPYLKTYSKDQQTKLQDMSSLGTFDSLDITLLYQMLRHYSSIQAPTKSWGEQPGLSDWTIGDDIERIRIFRNKFAHRNDIKITQNTFENYFSQFIDVGHRIDRHLGNDMNPSCEQEVINCKSCHMDSDLQIKFENALKRLENVILRFECKPIKFCYGDTFERSLNQLRCLLNEVKMEGNEKIRFQIVVGNEAELNEAALLLNEMKDEINHGLVGIELKEAYPGSVVLDVLIEVKYLETEAKLQSILNQFMERIVHSGIFKPYQTQSIEAVLVPIEAEYKTGLPIANEESLSTELFMSLLYLDFEVNTNMFETDESLQSNLLKTVTNVLTKSNVVNKRKDVTATLLPISLGSFPAYRFKWGIPFKRKKVNDQKWKDLEIISSKISQTEPLLGMIRNFSYGYCYPVDDELQLFRYLLLGFDTGLSVYRRQQKKRKEIECINRLITNGKGPDVVMWIKNVNMNTRTWDQNHLISVLALCATCKDSRTTSEAFTIFLDVCKTPTHLFQFIEFCYSYSENAKLTRKVLSNVEKWYNQFADNPEKLAYLVTKYRSRSKWTHKSILRLVHRRLQHNTIDAIICYITKGLGEAYDQYGQSTDQKTHSVMQFLRAVHEAKYSDSIEACTELIAVHNLSMEHLPTSMLDNKSIWGCLIRVMTYRATLRNLTKMSILGLLASDSFHEKIIITKLNTAEPVHPYSIFVALETYKSGNDMYGKSQWPVNKNIVMTLEKTFLKSFEPFSPTNKRLCLALDVSRSMFFKIHSSSVNAFRLATEIISLTAKSEDLNDILVFSNTIEEVKVDCLEFFISRIRPSEVEFNDCSLPIQWALEKKKVFDTFVIYTNSQNYSSNIHPVQAIAEYRSKINCDTKLIVVGMASNGFSIANQDDPLMLDLVAMDRMTPYLITKFIKNELIPYS